MFCGREDPTWLYSVLTSGAVYDLITYKQFLVLVTQQGVIEVYKDYQLIKKIANLNISTVYNYGPGLQCEQFSRLLFLLPSGLVFFVAVKEKNHVMYLDLENEHIPVHKIPSIQTETITSLYVHICNQNASILETIPTTSHNFLYSLFTQ